ncbi:MAG: oxidoreductase [Gammaproteobacteria bacterium]|nr:oxidoreductase [Gammaproteobacteria bacterium]MYD76606.1 oxidoreductase [Gammaproteobacteria bacterium]
MSTFKAFRIHQEGKEVRAGYEQLVLDDLTEGEVVVRVEWSGINYKDVLAATGKGRILRQSPLNGGIDLSGTVAESRDPGFRPGDEVLVCGCGLSETADGGYSEYARVKAGCLVPLPEGMTTREAMAIGTAGFTAAMAVVRMQENRQSPDMGPIVVTGATGGVGCLAIDMLASSGYEVVAFTGKKEQHAFLSELGASDFIDRHSIEMGEKPLERASWGGAVDNAGGNTLAWLTRTVKPWGNIASIGLVDDFRLNTTVMPFILRGVSILGINSIEMSSDYRALVWSRVGSDLKPRHLDRIVTREVGFDDLTDTFAGYLSGNNTGRTVVKIQN